MNSIIRNIFERCLNISESKKDRDYEQVFGYYISIKTQEIPGGIEYIRKLMLSSFKCGRTTMLGESNSNDVENILGLTLEFIYVALHDIFTGERNYRLNRALQIHSIDDINRILNDPNLVHELCCYIYVEVQNKFRTHIQKGNQDFEVYNEDGAKKFRHVKKLYINDTKYKEEILAEEVIERTPGELSKHIIDTYFDKLTKKQQQWVECALEFNISKDGAIYNFNNELLYDAHACYDYRVSIKKRLLPYIETDKHIDLTVTKKPRWQYRR